MALLGVNIDHVATLRQARGTRYPDPVDAAFMATRAGADGITVHLREDRRHIQERDVRLLKDTLTVPMNLELAATAEMVDIACDIAPQKCCIVPEKRAELTTEGGLDVVSQQASLAPACRALAAAGVEVSLFIDPDTRQIDAAAALGVPVVEIHTGHYADAVEAEAQAHEFERVRTAVDYAGAQALGVNAGHGLHYHNTTAIAALATIHELNIGHAIIARALLSGLAPAVADMKALVQHP